MLELSALARTLLIYTALASFFTFSTLAGNFASLTDFVESTGLARHGVY